MQSDNVIRFPAPYNKPREKQDDANSFDDTDIRLPEHGIISLDKILQKLEITVFMLNCSIDAMKNNDLPEMIKIRNLLVRMIDG